MQYVFLIRSRAGGKKYVTRRLLYFYGSYGRWRIGVVTGVVIILSSNVNRPTRL